MAGFDAGRMKAALRRSRMVLVVGFGGLLVLMAFAGVDGVQTLRQIQSRNDDVRDEFLARTRILEKLRSDLYLSGTYVRDYLLEPDPGKAESHRLILLQTRVDIYSALDDFRRLANRDETAPFRTLTDELGAYWKVLEPVFRWRTGERQRDGYTFLRDEVFPRRTAMLAIADQIARIGETQLIAGKVRVQKTFASFRGRLILTIGLTIGLGLLLAGFTMRQSLHLETEIAERYQEIATARAELQQLSSRLVEAQEQERRAISRELHDEVGQSLSGVLVELANLSTAIRSRDIPLMEQRAAEIRKQVEGSVCALRNMALLLRPSMLDDLGLIPALQWQAREVSKRSGVRVKIIAGDVSEDLPEEQNTCIFRVVQEALHNCVQHAAAKLVQVTVRQQDGHILLQIRDDGVGFDARHERGMGLLGMQERVTHLGGTFQVNSQPGRGAELSVALPVAHRLVRV